jgi:hypothetical protein
MDSNELYNSCLKMLDDKYNIKSFSKEIFMNIYNDIYKDDLITPNNNSNKLVLMEVKKKVEEKKDTPDLDLELKIKEIEKMRSAIINIKPAIIENENDTNNQINMKPQTPIQISNYNQVVSQKFKTFIINTFKNNFKVNPNININTYNIYPCCISIPIDIKNKTPYIILVISDGTKNNTYIYNPIPIVNATWDIWKPITDDYIDISLNNNNNNWNISLLDWNYNPIELNEYLVIINDVLEQNNYFSLNIGDNKINNFNINDKIKIIKENGESSENRIFDINNNRLFILKGNLKINDFINGKIINFKHNISLTFKYHLK